MNIVTDVSFLTKPCKPVSKEDGLKIAEALEKELESRSEAVGLAANQVGIDATVFSIKIHGGVKSFVNPKIIEKQNPRLFKDEGCLSLPGKRVNTIRFESILIEDLIFGQTKLENFAAIIAQHEYDHICGVLMREANIYDLCPCGSGKKFKFCHLR
jgi:peptide deformylase